MKNSMKIWLVFLLSGAFLNLAQALDTPELRIINAGLGKQFAIKVAGLEEANAIFEVRTQRGRTLLQKDIRSTEYQGMFDLEKLAEGEYEIVLHTASQKIVQPIRLTKRAVLYNVMQRELIINPEIKLSGRQLDIDYLNPMEYPVRVSLQSDDGHVLHEQALDPRTDIELRMNLLQLASGNYRVVVEAGEHAWSEHIKVN